jgi:trigger factor
MQVSVETTQGLERRLTITVPAEKVGKEYTARLNKAAHSARIDGFRKGKAPRALIEKMYGPSITADAADAVIQSSFVEALVSEKLNPVGAPKLESNNILDPKADFTFTISFEVFPEVKVQNVDAIKVEKPVASITDADLDKMLTTLRKQHADWVDTDEAAANELRVNMDFTGSIDGEKFEGGKAEGFNLVIGAGRMIPGFEDGILGKKAGESFDISVKFPEDYHAENLKGKDAKFAIKLNKVEKQQLPEMDADFVKRFGVEDGSLDGLKTEIRKNMDRELTQALKNKTKEQILTGLLEQNPVDVPTASVAREIDALRKQALQRFGAADSKNLPQLPDELFKEQAERRVRIGLLLGEVIREQDIKADDERVKTLIESLATAYEDPKEVVDYYFGNERLLNNMRDVAIEEQAIEYLLSKAQVTEKQTSFDEVINQQQ